MTAVGIFLGVQPGDGGMFQYAQSMLQGLLPLHASGVQVKVAYVAPLWQPLLSAYPYTLVPLSRGEFGMRMAAGAMAARLPGSLSRLLGRVANPVVAQMRRMDCALWLFPAQDSLGYQVDFPVISSVHDLMHRYEGRFPEVSEGGRFGIREHRFRNLVSWSKLVLVDSTVGRQHVVESYGANPAKVLPLPYVAPQYIAQPEPADFEAKYPLQPSSGPTRTTSACCRRLPLSARAALTSIWFSPAATATATRPCASMPTAWAWPTASATLAMCPMPTWPAFTAAPGRW
jgi:hypothetical protein